MTSELPEFIRHQNAFAEHIKNPQHAPRPADVDDRHMAVYRDLFFKNVMSFLDGTFPVLAEIIGPDRWQQIGRDFFARHENTSPYFLEISREFLSYLEHEFQALESDPAYMYELAHYEWLELFVDVEPAGEAAAFDANGDLLAFEPVLAPVVEGFLYQYPVHQISPQNPSPDPQQTALIVYRNRDDDVGFAACNPFTLQLLALLKQGGRTGQQCIQALLESNGFAGNEAAYQGGGDTLNHWQSLGIILGAAA
jgi:hypothetical protein